MSNTNDKAFLILTQISTYAEPVTVKALSHDLQMPISSVYRYISLLKEWNYIEESSHNKTVSIGATSLLLTKSYEKSRGTTSEIQAALERLREATDETAVYMVPVGYYALCVDSRESSKALRCTFDTGQTQPLIKGASSKVILANFPANRQHKIAEFYGVDDRAQTWVTEMQKIKQDGYCVSYAEYNQGVVGVSVPILRKNSVYGALSVMLPIERMGDIAQLAVQSLLNEASVLRGVN